MATIELCKDHGYVHRVKPGAQGKPIFGVFPDPKLEPGSADKLTQSYNYRLCVTRRPDNRVPFPKRRREAPSGFPVPPVLFNRLRKFDSLWCGGVIRFSCGHGEDD